MRAINNEIDRLGSGKWRPICSIDRGDVVIELQTATEGDRQRMFASRCEKRWQVPRNVYEGGYYSYHYFKTPYVPTEQDRQALLSRIS